MKICLVTPGQPSSNPRLVKEADALTEAGYDVHVVAAHWADWATEADRDLVASRRWALTFVDWRRVTAPGLFHASRLRQFAARRLANRVPGFEAAATAALSRVGPELKRAAQAVDADLYVAHNLGALPIVGAVAAARRARAAFDAEDFHSGQSSEAEGRRAGAFIRGVERRWLSSCAYVTAASPAIAEAYRDLYAMALPTTILNVFPLRDRPAHLRAHDPAAPVRLYWFSQTIGPDRGLEDVVAAMAELRDASVELHLRGAWQPGFDARLRRLAAEGGIPESRIMHHPPAPPDEMVRLAAHYDVGLAVEPGASVNNGLALSNKIFTYLLAGCAVVATRTPGQAALTSELGSAAAWCDPQSPASLAAVLKEWIAHRHALQAARTEAWRLGGTRFNWDVERHRYLTVVATSLGRSETQQTAGARVPRVPAAS